MRGGSGENRAFGVNSGLDWAADSGRLDADGEVSKIHQRAVVHGRDSSSVVSRRKRVRRAMSTWGLVC